jgi:hypothetical protein
MTRRTFAAAILVGPGVVFHTGAADPIPKSDEPADESAAVRALFRAMTDGTYRGVSFPKLTRDDIPSLLARAASRRTLTSFPRNPFSSRGQPECVEGMVALWLIEGIRKGGVAPSLNALCLPATRLRADEWDAASARNREAVRDAYRAWWAATRDRPAAEANAVDPLAGTGLHWY